MSGSRLGPAGFCLKALWWVISQAVLGADSVFLRWSLTEKTMVYSDTGMEFRFSHWDNNATFLCLCFLICQMGILPVHTPPGVVERVKSSGL